MSEKISLLKKFSPEKLVERLVTYLPTVLLSSLGLLKPLLRRLNAKPYEFTKNVEELIQNKNLSKTDLKEMDEIMKSFKAKIKSLKEMGILIHKSKDFYIVFYSFYQQLKNNRERLLFLISLNGYSINVFEELEDLESDFSDIQINGQYQILERLDSDPKSVKKSLDVKVGYESKYRYHTTKERIEKTSFFVVQTSYQRAALNKEGVMEDYTHEKDVWWFPVSIDDVKRVIRDSENIK